MTKKIDFSFYKLKQLITLIPSVHKILIFNI
jgi:hypothetical protein